METAFDAAARQALACFPIEARGLELASISENVTFHVTDASGGGHFALRLHRPGYNTLDELESERMWTAALAEAGVRVQQPLFTADGNGFCRVTVPGEKEPRFAGMTRWVPGTPLADSVGPRAPGAARREAFRAIGRLAARLHNQSEVWELPRRFTRRALDVAGLLGEAPRWGRFWEHAALRRDERTLLLEARAALVERLRAYGMEAARYGLIHADLHAENVLVHDGRVGIIDFDDAAFGWHGYDLATALIEQSSDADFATLREALLAGYRELRAFGDEDRALLDDFLLLRGMALIGWYHQRPEHAGAAYFEETRARVLVQCERLLGA